jgi:prepilin-type N-terminal cleavage/methylation domain-containing protein/prepilin-type processing-associated H-X9-DG protein
MQKRKGFTLIELLVVIAIIAILAAILFPVFARARENARRASCQSNLKQIALGVFQYTQDYDEKYPQSYIDIDGAAGWQTPTTATGDQGWAFTLQPYLKSIQIFQCPSETTAPGPYAQYGGATYTDYWMNRIMFGKSQAAIDSVSLTVMNGDGNSYDSLYYYDGTVANTSTGTATTAGPITGLGTAHLRHLDGGNFAFADGHVKWQKGDGVGSTAGSSAVRNAIETAAAGKPYFGIN